jgi:nucleotide-binding universal stress UspA family protein
VSSFHRILVGWDGSTDARRALRTAAHLAEEIRGEVVVLAVLKRHSHAEAADEAAQEMAGRRRDVVAEMTAATQRDSVPGTVHFRLEMIEADQAAAALDAYVREHGFDLVVLGRHGLDRAVHPRVGGVTEYQVRHSTCPVMVVGTD